MRVLWSFCADGLGPVPRWSAVNPRGCSLRLVLRIATDDSKAACRLSVKFGVPLRACRGLLERAKELGLDVIGVSFHVGSGCTDPNAYTQAIADARCVFDIGVSRCPLPPPHCVSVQLINLQFGFAA